MKKIALILTCMILTSCTCTLQMPAERISNTLLPEYIKYVEADSTLTPSQIQRRKDAVLSFREAVQAGKQ